MTFTTEDIKAAEDAVVRRGHESAEIEVKALMPTTSRLCQMVSMILRETHDLTKMLLQEEGKGATEAEVLARQLITVVGTVLSYGVEIGLQLERAQS